MAPLALIANLALSTNIELVSSSARVTSVKSNQTSLTDLRTTGPNYRTPGLPGSDKKPEYFLITFFCFGRDPPAPLLTESQKIPVFFIDASPYCF